MRPSEKLLSDLDDWAVRNENGPAPRRRDSLRTLLSRSLRGISEELLSGVLERWSALAGEKDGKKRARAWLDAVCLLFLMDYGDEPPLNRDDWVYIREIFSAEAEILDMNLLSYVMERVLDHGGF